MIISSYYPTYSPRFWFVRDEPNKNSSLLFQIAEGKYILTLVAILRFFEDSIYSEDMDEEVRRIKLDILKRAIDDLLYVDENYVLVSKKNNSIK